MKEATSLREVLQGQAAASPDRLAFAYLDSDEQVAASLTYGQLEQRVRALAAGLNQLAPEGARAILALPAGLDFIVSYLACCYAKVMAVPLPEPLGGRRGIEALLRGVAAEATPSLVLTNPGSPLAAALALIPGVTMVDPAKVNLADASRSVLQ